MMCDADMAVLDEIMEEATSEVNVALLAFRCGEVSEAERDAALACWRKTHEYWMGIRLARRAGDEAGVSA